MKTKIFNLIIIFSTIVILLACNNQQKQINKNSGFENDSVKIYNFEDLTIKYEIKKITNCSELLEMANDFSDIYFKTIDNAVTGNEKAKSDFWDFEKFNIKFDSICNIVGDSCNDFFNWKQNFIQKRNLYFNKIDSLYKLDTLKYNYKIVSDSIYNNLNKQLKELEEDLKVLQDTQISKK